MKAGLSNQTRGMSTLELLIAFAIISLALTAGIVVVFGNQNLGVDAQTNIEAIGKAQALLEQQRALARQDFSSVQTTSPTQDSIYTKKVTVSYPVSGDTDTKLVTSQVTWLQGIRPLSVSFSTIVTNAQSGSFCSATLSSPSGWKDPTAYVLQSSDLVRLSPVGSSANGLGVSGISVFRNKMYLVANATPGSDTHTLYIYGVSSNPTVSPTFSGWANTTGNSLAGIAVAAKGSSLYAYVISSKAFNFSSGCNSTNCPQFQVVDVTTATAPVWKTGLMMPVTGSGGQGIGSAIAYDKGYVYVGLAKAAGSSDPEFNIIDVGGGSASPTSPVRVGGYHVGFTVKSIAIEGNYAYLSTTDTTTTNRQLIVLDISNKSNPTVVYSFTAPDNFGVANSVVAKNGSVYLGKAYSSTYPNFYIFDGTAPASSFATLGSKQVGANDSVNSIVVRDHYAFLVTNKQFQIWDVSNPASMVPWTIDGTTGSFYSLTDNINSHVNASSASSCSGDFLYVALQTSQGNTKDIIAIMGPTVPSSYSLSTSGNISLIQGTGGSVTVTAAITSGYPGSKTFTASGLPTGATAAFSPAACQPGCTSMLTLTTSAATPIGSYPITVTGTGGITTNFTLAVTPLPFNYTLTNSGNITVAQGAAGNNTITRTLTQGTTQAVTLAVSGLPAGASATIGNNGCSATCSGTLTINASAATPTGTYLITVTDAANSKTTTFNLIVTTPPFAYTASLPASVSFTRTSPGTVVVTLTKTSGTAQAVTNVALSPLPQNVSASPTSGSCTPNPTCTVTFTLSINSAAHRTGTATVSGTPAPSNTASINITAN
jgi:type II secretory pathway pseudopilin PulG